MAEKSNLKIEERITEFEKTEHSPQPSRPKIQRVANNLRNRDDFAKHYSPKLVSIGPIHHGDPNLEQGEKYKLMWASKYIKNNAQTSLVLYEKIADKFEEELKDLFTTDLFTDEKFSNYASEDIANLEEKLCWMLFVDGCALLQILEKANLHIPDRMNVKVDQLVLVMQDVLLLENQLPYLLLKLLWKNDDESTLIETMKEFLKCHRWATPSDKKQQGKRKQKNQEDIEGGVPQVDSPTHLLDLQRRIILPPENRIDASNQTRDKETDMRCPPPFLIDILDMMRSEKAASIDMVTYQNARELKTAGIRLKSSKTRRPRDVSFNNGWFQSELTLPVIVVDDTTAATFLNLIAYEMCPDFNNDFGICSFAAFMDSLIEQPDDVKALRSEGILLNYLKSDEEVVTLFHRINTDLVLVPDMVTYSEVRDQINKHYSTYQALIAQAIHSPWTFTAFVAAFLGLALTFVQTWFAIFPKS